MSKTILYIIYGFAVLGCIDKIIGNKYGLGEKFNEGFLAMGNLAIPVIGIYALTPVIAHQLSKIITPLFEYIGADPSIFPASILPCNMGGYTAAMNMAQSNEIGVFSGFILASMLGATIGFTIPTGAGILEKEDQMLFTKGILAGMITIPLGCLVGGLLLGLSIPVLLINIIPVIFISIAFTIGLVKWPNQLLNGFNRFSKATTIISTLGIIISIFEKISGLTLIPGMSPFDEGLKIVGTITIILCGAYPMIHVITKVFKTSLLKFGNMLGIGETAVLGMLISLSSNVPSMIMMKDMDERGKVLLSAFLVSGAFTLGGQLGFVASIDKTAITPFILSKLAAGVSAIAVGMVLTRNMSSYGEPINAELS